MNWDLYLNFMAAMIAIVNPLAILPIWSQLTNDLETKARSETALMIVGTSASVLLVFLIAGKYILSFFSINLPVFQIAGGILLLFTGLSMVNGRGLELKKKEVVGERPFQVAKNRFRDIIVPMAIPMLSGPGSLTTVLLYGNRTSELIDFVVLSVFLLMVLGLLHLTFNFSGIIEKKIDPIVFNILSRLLGILVVAIAVQFIVEGLSDLFPALSNGFENNSNS
ncbi:MAG: MarC family protein [Bacteroidota bacterium]